MLLLLGRVALVAQRPIVVERSVGLFVCPVASALWKNGGSDPGAVWHCRSDGSNDEAGGVWRSVHGKGTFGEQIWGVPLSTGTYWTYMCYSAVVRPSCQITLGRLVIIIIICSWLSIPSLSFLKIQLSNLGSAVSTYWWGLGLPKLNFVLHSSKMHLVTAAEGSRLKLLSLFVATDMMNNYRPVALLCRLKTCHITSSAP